uniref:Uncharacterized protein n=1 Tax=Romanomermis culicivorax TaxID=13658 RepID=A0A915I048_ROMCU
MDERAFRVTYVKFDELNRYWEIACFNVCNMVSQSGHFGCQLLHLLHHQLHNQRLGSDSCRKR